MSIRIGYTGEPSEQLAFYSTTQSNILHLATSFDNINLVLETSRGTTEPQVGSIDASQVKGNIMRIRAEGPNQLRSTGIFQLLDDESPLFEVGTERFQIDVPVIFTTDLTVGGNSFQANLRPDTKFVTFGGGFFTNDVYAGGGMYPSSLHMGYPIDYEAPSNIPFSISNVLHLSNTGTLSTSNLVLDDMAVVRGGLVTSNISISADKEPIISFLKNDLNNQIDVQIDGNVYIENELYVRGTFQFDQEFRARIITANEGLYSRMIDLRDNSDSVISPFIYTGYTGSEEAGGPDILMADYFDKPRFTINREGAIGIGTRSPAALLDIYMVNTINQYNYPGANLAYLHGLTRDIIVNKDGNLGLGIAPTHPLHIIHGNYRKEIPVGGTEEVELFGNYEDTSLVISHGDEDYPFLVLSSNASPKFVVNSKGHLLIGDEYPSTDGYAIRTTDAYIDNMAVGRIFDPSPSSNVLFSNNILSDIFAVQCKEINVIEVAEISSLNVGTSLKVQPGGPAALPALLIDSQNVGINTEKADYTLHVNGIIFSQKNVLTSSDARLKKDIKRIPNALQKLLQMYGYTYTRDGEPKKEAGVIAQEVQRVLPEAVYEDDAGNLSVAYGSLIGLLVEAVRELYEATVL